MAGSQLFLQEGLQRCKFAVLVANEVLCLFGESEQAAPQRACRLLTVKLTARGNVYPFLRIFFHLVEHGAAPDFVSLLHRGRVGRRSAIAQGSCCRGRGAGQCTEQSQYSPPTHPLTVATIASFELFAGEAEYLVEERLRFG